MGRKSSLSAAQWVEVGKRLLEGESPEALSADFTAKGSKISPASIRAHFARKGQSTKTVQQVAGEIYDAKQAELAAQRHLKELPAAAQYAAVTLAARMMSVFESLAQVAETHASTAVGLAGHANEEALKLDGADPASFKRLPLVRELLKASNDAADLPRSMFVAAANRDAVKRVLEEQPAATTADSLTPERLKDGVRRLAFLLHRAGAPSPETS